MVTPEQFNQVKGNVTVTNKQNFNSANKYSAVETSGNNVITYYKGTPERLLAKAKTLSVFLISRSVSLGICLSFINITIFFYIYLLYHIYNILIFWNWFCFCGIIGMLKIGF